MLAVPADRLPAALADLDPGNRALLDLSLRRGVSDAEIGELLRKDPGDVARGRDAVLELLADALEVGGPERRERVRLAVAALPDDAWRTKAAAAPPGPPPPPAPPAREPAAERPPGPKPPERRDEEARPAGADGDRDERERAARELDEDAYFKPDDRGSRRGRFLALLGLAVVVGVLLAVLLSSGGDDDEPDRADRTGAEPAPANGGQGGQDGEPAGESAQLTTLGAGPGGGRLTVTDEGAIVTLRGLPDPEGSYQVWLYNNVVQAQSLGSIPRGEGRIRVRLPSDARRYRFLDVSREPDDANPNHSGESVMRAPLGELLGE